MGSEMDEAEKYKQRLEAIAERRRLQEEEDRIRREMDDEKIRLQQLKRKSLRDQWLMEATPSPPTSPEARSPHNPYWGSPAQQMNKHRDGISRLSSETQRLEQNMKGHREDGMDKVDTTREQLDMGHNTAAVHNGDTTVPGNGYFHAGSTVVVTNGGENLEEMSTDPYIQVTANRQGESLTSSSGAGPSIDSDGEEEEMMVMRAECVIITDEEEDSEVDIQRSEESLVFVSEAAQHMEKQEEGSQEKPAEESGPDHLEGPDRELGEINCNVTVEPTEKSPEGASVAPLPLYSEFQPSVLLSEQEPEQQGEPDTTTTQDCGSPSEHFQEVPLSEAKHMSAAEEQKPLLTHAKENSILEVEPDDISTEIHEEVRAVKKEMKPKQTKACQCCSVM